MNLVRHERKVGHCALVVEPVGVCTKYYVLLVHILEKFSRAIEEAGEESK